MKRVLSIDGGGIRGIIPAELCRDIEDRSSHKISALFDLIAGTSTGGILALGLAAGKPAETLLQLYLEKGEKIFSNPGNFITQSNNPKFSNSGLDAAVSKIFEDLTISQAVVDLLVLSYDTQLRRPIYFSRDEALKKKELDFTMRDVALATSAAPTYFPSWKIKRQVLIDGAMVANNPSAAAYAHAKKLWPGEEVLLLSMGTGSIARPLSELRKKEFGLLQWARPVIDCFMDGTSQATDDFFRKAHRNSYLRLQGGLDKVTEDMDNASEECLDGLQRVAAEIIKQHEVPLDAFLERLIEAGKPLHATISTHAPDSKVPLGSLRVGGKIYNYRGEVIYAFTGKLGRYWPSARVIPQGDDWTADLNVGQRAKTATVTLAALDQDLALYVEFYRERAVQLGYPGISLTSLKGVLASVNLILDHSASTVGTP